MSFDPEIQQLRGAVLRDQDVARLYVPMHHQMRMRILHGGANAAEQVQPFCNRALVGFAVVVYRSAFDILHYEIRRPVGGRTGVNQPRDIGMVKVRQNLPFQAEAPQDLSGVHAAFD